MPKRETRKESNNMVELRLPLIAPDGRATSYQEQCPITDNITLHPMNDAQKKALQHLTIGLRRRHALLLNGRHVESRNDTVRYILEHCAVIGKLVSTPANSSP